MGVLTIDSQGHLSLPGPHPGHHGSAHVLPSILLADGFEGQGLLVAQDLGELGSIRHREWGWVLSVFRNQRPQTGLEKATRARHLRKNRAWSGAGGRGRPMVTEQHLQVGGGPHHRGWEAALEVGCGVSEEEGDALAVPRGAAGAMTLQLTFAGPWTCLCQSLSGWLWGVVWGVGWGEKKAQAGSESESWLLSPHLPPALDGPPETRSFVHRGTRRLSRGPERAMNPKANG